ncbi:MAG: GMC family oxidoreductase, partial [Candidatus Latescibacteria bacterium]|nr:GMC family oxidoreductase [Candidatus Latescibacterota bacterium]
IEKNYQGPSPLHVKQYEDPDFGDMVENEVVGGMSVFYGGASLRLRERDFNAWPISYSDLEPYYDQVEDLLEVHGEMGGDLFEPSRKSNYLRKPIDLTPPAQRILRAGQALGHQPFRIPLAINFSNVERTVCIRCLTCDGFPCQIEAKNDLTMTLLKKAQEAGADIVAGVQVVRMAHTRGKVHSIVCIDRKTKETFEVPAPIVIVAAGALQSPAILLRSELDQFPCGDLIGRFLMRHCNAVVAGIFPFRTNPEGVFHKQLCFSDFYEDFRGQDGMAVGLIQDIYTPAPEVLKDHAPFGFKHAAAFSAECLQNLLCVAEDEPQYENRVGLAEHKDVYGIERAQVTHCYTDRDCERRDYLVGKAKAILRKAGAFFFHTYQIDSFSHGVGSVRMGDKEETSVLNPSCQFRGLDNLFVVDSSVFPASGGVNPSLTIAANALRIADVITNLS